MAAEKAQIQGDETARGERGALAHVDASSGATGRAHRLDDHLTAVAGRAAAMAAAFAPRWAHLAGLWHDLGKYRPGFQRYIRQQGGSDAHIEGRVAGSDKTHSAAGALHALKLFEHRWGRDAGTLARALAYVIAGHHAGLSDWQSTEAGSALAARLSDAVSAEEYRSAIEAAQREWPAVLELPAGFDVREAAASIPGVRGPLKLAHSLWVRMVFSALIDADFLDTEAFFDGDRAEARRGYPALREYLDRLERHLADKSRAVLDAGLAGDPVMQARADVLRQCLEKAAHRPGVFTLTVPTGGGKTLSSLAFALAHAVRHGRHRVIYAIPYTSIIEQTADVFAGIFGAENLVEHHSQTEFDDRLETHRSRLACENWDAPLIVTTNVQLFESLFAARTSRCRKLHNLANSVIVLDEAQLLPPAFLQPILDTLNVLVAHYGVTLVLCTATQPALTSHGAFDARRALRGLPEPTRIIDDEPSLFRGLHRVAIRWPADLGTACDLRSVADELRSHECVLAIVNTRGDAFELARQLGADALHLSAAMCGAHRKFVIDAIRERLRRRQAGDPTPLRVVSTQLVEAGVDVDFPVVYRALAGLDSIAQAAGRCNREGRLRRGEVVVFVRDIPRPLAQLRAGVAATRAVLTGEVGDVLMPDVFDRYFGEFYRGQRLDERNVVADLEAGGANGVMEFNFRTAAAKFKLVDDAQHATLVVPYRSDRDDDRIVPLIRELEQGRTDRWLLRAVQRYTLSVRLRDLERMRSTGGAAEVVPGIFVLRDESRYDARFGLMSEGLPLSPESLVQ